MQRSGWTVAAWVGLSLGLIPSTPWSASLTPSALAAGKAVVKSESDLPPSSSSLSDEASKAAVRTFVQLHAHRLLKAVASHEIMNIREQLLAPVKSVAHPPSAMYRSVYAAAIAENFGKILADSSATPAMQIQAINLIAMMDDMATDAVLESSLTHPNPGVRYWSARGLSTILSQLKDLGSAFERAITRANEALKTETSPVVAAEILTLLGSTNHPTALPAMLEYLKDSAQKSAKTTPTNFEPLIAGLKALNQMAVSGKIAAGDQVAAAAIAAQLASFVAQHDYAGGFADPDHSQVLTVLDSSVTLLNTLSKAKLNLKLTAQSSKDEVLLAVNGLTGAENTSGEAQKLFPALEIPPRIPAKKAS